MGADARDLRIVCEELIAAAGQVPHGVSLRGRFVGKAVIERELASRGYKLEHLETGWIAVKVDRGLRLEPGKFYVSRGGHVWCCFELEPDAGEYARAWCVQLGGSRRTEYFYQDGRYDERGTCEHTLLEEVKRPAR